MTVVHVTAPMLAAYDHFLAVGFTKNGAAAPVGNGSQESGEFLVATMFRAHPDWSGGVPEALKSGGFEEWLGDRKTACIAFIGRTEQRLGVPKNSLLNDLGTQCDFVVYELQTNPRYATLYQQLTTGTRSIANLTANFMAIYEVPALRTANLDNRIAHAEAVAARAAEIKAATAPQPGPPVPVPPLTAPIPPAPIPPVPAPSVEPSPASASGSGRRAAVLDNLEAMRQAYLAERAAIDKEMGILETTISDFGKLASLPTTPLRLPATVPAAQPQRTFSMPPNIWTSIFGTGGVLAAGVAVFTSIKNGQTPDATQVAILLGMISTGIGLIKAKDANVTGGSIPQTNEAKARATSAPIT